MLAAKIVVIQTKSVQKSIANSCKRFLVRKLFDYNKEKPQAYTLFTVIDRAAVPIVKMRDLLTDIKVDISFNMESGVTSVSLIKEFIRQFPALPYLVLLLKQFLLQRSVFSR